MTREMCGAYKRALLFVAAAAVLATTIASCGRSGVAVVSGRKITRDEYYSRLERLLVPLDPPRDTRQVQAGLRVLKELIDEELIVRLADQEKIPATEEQINQRYAETQRRPEFANFMKTMSITKEQAKEMMRAQQALFNLQTRGVNVTPKETRAFYEKNKNTLYTTPENATVAAIFAKGKAATDKAMSMLKKGVDFGTVAMQLSEDRTSAERGGRLGRQIFRGDPVMPDDVENKVLSTKKGSYTQPIPSGDETYVIFKVLEHRPKTTQSFANVRYAIWHGLMVDKGQKKNSVGDKLTKFRDKADIKVNIERYKEQLLPPKPAKKK